MNENADLRKLNPYLSFEEQLPAIPIFATSHLCLTTVGGTREMRFVDIDFDDVPDLRFGLHPVRHRHKGPEQTGGTICSRKVV